MVDISGKYLGQKRVELTHGPSQSKIQTDAPVDNNGKGELFSPTDLVASALGTCMLTVMGIFAESRNLSLEGSYFKLKKIMGTNPRRIVELPLEIHLPQKLENEIREKLMAIGDTCPVRNSIHSDIKVEINYLFDI